MAGLIPRSFIDDLLARVDIVDVIDSRVPLKKAGANHKACCPFHGEKTPSFTVSQSKQFYHCFGCGVHGTAISFLMEYERLDFPEAVEELARSIGVEVPRENSGGNPAQQKQSADLYSLMQAISDQYQLELRKTPSAIEYLKKRGLSGDIAKQYGIGYVPDSWDFVLKSQGKQAAQQKQLESAGMLIRNEEKQRLYDRFRGRIMFPIRDPRGKTIAFGGRVIDQGEPKYLNSPETPIFHKGKELYGLYEIRQYAGKVDTVIVTEGYMDVVMLAQFGVRNAVASLGTACTGDHIQRLFRTVDKVVFCFDGDRAGRDAAWRALNNTLPVLQDDKQISFLFLPDGEDPDSVVQKEGKDGFDARISSATPLSAYLINHLKEQVDMTSMDGRARLAELAKPLLAMIKAEVFLQLLKQELAREIQLPTEQLFTSLPTQASTPTPTPVNKLQSAKRNELVEMTTNRLLIACLVDRPSLANTVSEVEIAMLSTLNDKGVTFIIELLTLLQSNPHLNTAALLDRYRNSKYEGSLSRLASHEFQPDEDGEDSVPKIFQDAFAKLIDKARKQHYQMLLMKPLNELSETDRAFLKGFQA